MNKKLIKTSTMMLLGFALTLTSCKKDDATVAAPTVTVNDGTISATQDIAVSTKVALKLSATAGTDRTIKTVSIERAIPGQSTVKIFTATPSKLQYDYTYTDTVAGLVSNGTIVTYSVKATDNKDLATTTVFTVTFIQTNGILASSVITLGAQNNATVDYKFLGLANNFATYTAGTSGTAKSNSDKIDFVYYYGTNDKNAFAAPTNTDGAQVIWSTEIGSWTTKNDTKFKSTTITAAQFDDIKDNTKVDDSFATIDFTSGAVSKMTSLENNNVIAFKTASGKIGLIKFVTTSADNKGAASLVVICQD